MKKSLKYKLLALGAAVCMITITSVAIFTDRASLTPAPAHAGNVSIEVVTPEQGKYLTALNTYNNFPVTVKNTGNKSVTVKSVVDVTLKRTDPNQIVDIEYAPDTQVLKSNKTVVKDTPTEYVCRIEIESVLSGNHAKEPHEVEKNYPSDTKELPLKIALKSSAFKDLENTPSLSVSVNTYAKQYRNASGFDWSEASKQ